MIAYLANGSGVDGELNDTYEGDYGEDDRDDGGVLVFQCDDLPFSVAVATAASFTTIFCLSVCGNILLLYTLARYEDLRNVTNLLMLNVAVSDLVFAATLPFWSAYHLSHWVFGPALCRILTGAYFLGLYCSLTFLMALTVDRYVTVVHGKSSRPERRLTCARAGCAVLWLVSAAFAVREMVTTETREVEPGQFVCEGALGPWDERTAYFLQVGLLFLLPLGVVVFCYARILRVTMLRRSIRRHRSVTVVLCIVAAFFVCWGPYNLLLVLEAAAYGGEDSDCDSQARMNMAFTCCHILAYSHCCFNPILYTFTEKFRAHLSQLLLCCRPRQLGAANEGEGPGGGGAGHSISSVIWKEVVMQGDVSGATPKINTGVELKSFT